MDYSYQPPHQGSGYMAQKAKRIQDPENREKRYKILLYGYDMAIALTNVQL